MPGDSVTVEIDHNLLRNRNVHDFVNFSNTHTGNTNWLINKFESELPDENYWGNKSSQAEAELSPGEFVDYIMKREREYTDFSAKFNRENETTELFDSWVKDRLQYESWNDLMRYCWTHAVYNGIPQDSFKLSDSYFTFLNDYNMDDNRLFSRYHVDFLHEFMMYLMDKDM